MASDVNEPSEAELIAGEQAVYDTVLCNGDHLAGIIHESGYADADTVPEQLAMVRVICRDAARNAINVAAQVREREAWQDIATAPDDMSDVWVIGGNIRTAYLASADGDHWRRETARGIRGMPTHWMRAHRPAPLLAETHGEDGDAR